MECLKYKDLEHEFRNGISIIGLAAARLHRYTAMAEGNKLVDTIITESKRLEKLFAIINERCEKE